MGDREKLNRAILSGSELLVYSIEFPKSLGTGVGIAKTGETPVYSQRSNGAIRTVLSSLVGPHQGVSRRCRVKLISRASIEVSRADLYTIGQPAQSVQTPPWTLSNHGLIPSGEVDTAQTIPPTCFGPNTRVVQRSRGVGGVGANRAVFYTGRELTVRTATYQPEAGQNDGITEL